MVNQDLYEVFVPATGTVAGAVREFHAALAIARELPGEIWIRRNMQMEAWVRPAPPSEAAPLATAA
jgi:hypothetical protein